MDNKLRENEIVEKYDFLTERSRYLTDEINDIFQTKEKLRAEYQTLTGKDISERHNAK